MAEKRDPTYDLNSLKKAFSNPRNLVTTVSAKVCYIALGFDDQDVVDAIQSLTERDFYKSMSPEDENFVSWHDVYKSHFRGFNLYIKFQVNANKELILSFKENT